jgi:ribosomal protein S27AE
MSEEEKPETIEEDTGEEKPETEKEPEREPEKPLTRKELEDILNKRFPPKPPKTKAEKVKGEGGEKTEIDAPTCPRCHDPVISARYEGKTGYYCKRCGRFYIV